MIEHWYLACMILVANPFCWYHAVTFTFVLLHCQICCGTGYLNSSNLLIYCIKWIDCIVGNRDQHVTMTLTLHHLNEPAQFKHVKVNLARDNVHQNTVPFKRYHLPAIESGIKSALSYGRWCFLPLSCPELICYLKNDCRKFSKNMIGSNHLRDYS